MLTIFVPPLFLMGIEKGRMMPKNKPGKLSVEISLLLLELYFAVPLGLALYSRQGLISAKDLEPEFKQIKDSKGKLIDEFVFNKGL